MKKKNLIIIGLAIIIVLAIVFLKASKTVKNLARVDSIQKNTQTVESNNISAETEEDSPTVEIPAEKQQLMGVKTMVVKPKQVQKSIRTVGRIEYDERRITTINTKFEGWIEKLYADYTGEYVEKGEPLAEIYSPELFATQLELLNLLRWADPIPQSGEKKVMTDLQSMLSKDVESTIEAARQRLKLWDITEEQIKMIEKTRKPFRTLTIYSPVRGHIMQKPVVQGMRVMAGQKLFDIVDLSTVWVIADIYEYELPLIDVGQEAEISLSYIPGQVFRSRVEFLNPSLSSETKTAKIRFSLQNKHGLLKPQMFTEVTIKRNLGKRLVIPEDAVIDTGTRQIVYVDKGDGYFEPRQILPGLSIDGSVEVLKGLKPGEKIAISGNFLIDSEAKLKGIVK